MNSYSPTIKTKNYIYGKQYSFSALLSGITVSMLFSLVIYFLIIKKQYVLLDLQSFINQYSSNNINDVENFNRLLYIHTFLVIVISTSLLLNMGRYSLSIYLFIFGVRLGFVFTMLICLFGVYGLLCSISCFLPHDIIYMCSYKILINKIDFYRKEKKNTINSYIKVKKENKIQSSYYKSIYNIKQLCISYIYIITLIFIGIISEIYINPILIKYCFKLYANTM